jgi:23S rRNA (adenine1618-N6)-methyltransferase
MRQLTRSLLHRDFALTLTLPSSRLCPPVPVRYNYVRWLQDLLATTQPSHSDTFNPSRSATGLDIGVGASCIYALLACASAPAWHMHGTDIDTHSLTYAQANVYANKLSSRIKLHQTEPEDPLLPLDAFKIENLDFVICNPPFYSSEADMSAAHALKLRPPSAVCTGSTNEMITPGGDIGFATRILTESLLLRERVQWYSSMLCRLASVQQLVAKLREHGITNFAVTNLKAGHKTRRWAVAWSFGDLRPANGVARHGELVQAILPTATEWTVDAVGASKDGKVSDDGKLESLSSKLNTLLSPLDLEWHWRGEIHTGVAFARENVWSRSARRKRKFQSTQTNSQAQAQPKKEPQSDEASSSEEEETPPALAVKIVCHPGQVNIRWLRGTDFTLWESFCGMLKRGLGARGDQGREGGKGRDKMEE